MARSRITRDDYNPEPPKKIRKVRIRQSKPRPEAITVQSSPVTGKVIVQQDEQQPTLLNIGIAVQVDVVRFIAGLFGQ